MNITVKHGDKKILSFDKLFFAYVAHYFAVKDVEEKNPIPFIRIRECDQDSDRANIDLYFDARQPENEMRMYSNYNNHVSYSVTKMLQLATFTSQVQEYIMKNPNFLTEAKYS